MILYYDSYIVRDNFIVMMKDAWKSRPYANSGRRNIRDNMHLLFADPLTIQEDDEEQILSDRGLPLTPKNANELPSPSNKPLK